MAVKKKLKDFESAITRLEEITDELESGETSLEESIALYTEGLEIARYCDKKLTETEKKVKLIQEQDGALTERALDMSDEDDEFEEDEE
jgi:exodeoxyribonuclease VII small subunit